MLKLNIANNSLFIEKKVKIKVKQGRTTKNQFFFVNEGKHGIWNGEYFFYFSTHNVTKEGALQPPPQSSALLKNTNIRSFFIINLFCCEKFNLFIYIFNWSIFAIEYLMKCINKALPSSSSFRKKGAENKNISFFEIASFYRHHRQWSRQKTSIFIYIHLEALISFWFAFIVPFIFNSEIIRSDISSYLIYFLKAYTSCAKNKIIIKKKWLMAIFIRRQRQKWAERYSLTKLMKIWMNIQFILFGIL